MENALGLFLYVCVCKEQIEHKYMNIAEHNWNGAGQSQKVLMSVR